jgi:hypothetical protein
VKSTLKLKLSTPKKIEMAQEGGFSISKLQMNVWAWLKSGWFGLLAHGISIHGEHT